MPKNLKDLLTSLSGKVRPGHTALLVIDVQNDFCAEGGYVHRVLGKDVSPCQAVVEPICRLIEAARRANVPVIWVRADYEPRHLLEPVLAKQREMNIDAACSRGGSWGAEFFRLRPAGGDVIIEKHRYSAFAETELDALLRDQGIRTLVLAGVQTNICIESTFRDAFNKGYYLVIPEDCVASHAPSLHEAALINFSFLFGTTTSADELGGLWSASSDRISEPAEER